jgi:hypothetical protein
LFFLSFSSSPSVLFSCSFFHSLPSPPSLSSPSPILLFFFLSIPPHLLFLLKISFPPFPTSFHILSLLHSPPASAEVKNMWTYTSSPPYNFMAQCLII